MTEHDARFAVAEAVGWTRCKIAESSYGGRGDVLKDGWMSPSGTKVYPHQVPRYTDVLDCIQSAWRTLTSDQQRKAAWILVQLLDERRIWNYNEYDTIGVWEMDLTAIADCMLATPMQWAEAFLRVLNKYKE